MEFPKYDGNIHPDEWKNELQKYKYYCWTRYHIESIEMAKSLVDPTIKLPKEISNIDELCNVLKEDISFAVFKNTNKRILQTVKYIPERKGGNMSKFISNFRKLCYNSEINDVEEQKKYLYKSLPLYYISSEFHEKMKKVNSINELIKKFEDIVADEVNLITNKSVVALKHTATRKYLSSIKNLCYETGSKSQMVFVGSSQPDPNSLWKILFDEELAAYVDTSIRLQHIKSNMFLGLNSDSQIGHYYYSPSLTSNYTEVSCGGGETMWNFKHSKLENHQGYLKSNDIINLNIKKLHNNQLEFLRSHDIQFTIGDDAFQEVGCHNEILRGNDEWSIELIEQA